MLHSNLVIGHRSLVSSRWGFIEVGKPPITNDQ